MKPTFLYCLLFCFGVAFVSCNANEKDQNKDKEVESKVPKEDVSLTENEKTTMDSVTINTDKFPEVYAYMKKGVIILEGKVKKSDFHKLMQEMKAYNPTSINNQLELK